MAAPEEPPLQHRKILQAIAQIPAGLVFLFPFSFYPLLVLSLLFFNWQWSLIVFGVRFPGTGDHLLSSHEKLNEKISTLVPVHRYLDVFYYLLFGTGLVQKPKAMEIITRYFPIFPMNKSGNWQH